jgi:hypothetical protein
MLQTLCECATAYLVTSWVVGLIWVIRDWDKTVARQSLDVLLSAVRGARGGAACAGFPVHNPGGDMEAVE